MATRARRNKIKVDNLKFALRRDPKKLGEDLLLIFADVHVVWWQASRVGAETMFNDDIELEGAKCGIDLRSGGKLSQSRTRSYLWYSMYKGAIVSCKSFKK